MSSNSRKNVLLFIADDLGLYLGCYGTKGIKTPHVDALAAQGTKFTKAFASTASCSGSRSTMYTGLHTHQNGQYGLAHGWNHFQTHEHIETLPQIFNSLGYQTGIIGKVHVGPPSSYPWETFEVSQSRDVKWNASAAGSFFDKAESTDRPFHLTVAFRDPHRDNTRGGFGNDSEEVISAGIEVPKYKPEDVEVQPWITDCPELRTELVQYYESISRMDLGVGLVLEELKNRGLDENTLVIFVSDNGAPFLNSKTTLYESGIRLPFIVRCPGGANGVVNPNLVSFLDILPTCIAWSGASEVKTSNTGKSPPRLGTSILPILGASDALPADKWKQHVFGSHTFHEVQNYWPTRYMRTQRFKYHRNIAWRLDFPFGTDLYGSLSWEGIRNGEPPIMLGQRTLEKYLFRGPEELFDMEKDPLEVDNLAKKEEYKEVLEECRKAVESWQFETTDVWLFKDGISAITSKKHQVLGLKVPDRFDIDVNNPGNAVGPHWVAPEKENMAIDGLAVNSLA
ncbi:alkaline-phosphatase-like protein [Astrocystis sublimbata]|nr:alkaline-phosphatase-like protein [Astrocystis sublimbata]